MAMIQVISSVDSNNRLFPFPAYRRCTLTPSESPYTMAWQKTFTLAKRSKGCHLVTEEILSQIEAGLNGVQIGMLFLFIQHTSAALTVNENYDRGGHTAPWRFLMTHLRCH